TPSGLELLENTRREDIAADNGKSRGCGRRFWLLDNTVDAAESTMRSATRHDPISIGLVARNLLDAENAPVMLLVDVRHLAQARNLGIDEIIGQMHEKWLVADDWPRT